MHDYDHEKNLAAARRREERRELAVCAVAFGIKAVVLLALAFEARGSAAAGLLGTLAAVFVLGVIWAGTRWLSDGEEGA